MKVLAVGSESSGNRLLQRILETARPRLELVLCYGHGSDAPHPFTLPHHDEWLAISPDAADKIIVISRHSCVQAYRAWHNGHTQTLAEAVLERHRADRFVAAIAGDVYHVSYDLLVVNPETQVANLARWLGVELSVPEAIA